MTEAAIAPRLSGGKQPLPLPIAGQSQLRHSISRGHASLLMRSLYQHYQMLSLNLLVSTAVTSELPD
jgi:hypothetical protein